MAFKHRGFWQCMDTLRDKEILEKKIRNKEHFGQKNFNNWRNRFYWISFSKKMFKIRLVSNKFILKKPKKSRKLKKVKYVICDISNQKSLKKKN